MGDLTGLDKWKIKRKGDYDRREGRESGSPNHVVSSILDTEKLVARNVAKTHFFRDRE